MDFSFDWLSDPQGWIALITLTLLELVLGIDNIIFISIICGKLPSSQQRRARTVGLILAVVTRLIFLSFVTYLRRFESPLFGVLGQEISGRDLVLLIGGLFLIAKSTREIHEELQVDQVTMVRREARSTFGAVVAQVLVLDIVFSIDSVITAVGMVEQITIMMLAVVISILFMLWFAGPVAEFVKRHPTVKMLALSFLILIGVALIGEGLDLHIPKGYIYFAMAFSFVVEVLNMKLLARAPAKHAGDGDPSCE